MLATKNRTNTNSTINNLETSMTKKTPTLTKIQLAMRTKARGVVPTLTIKQSKALLILDTFLHADGQHHNASMLISNDPQLDDAKALGLTASILGKLYSKDLVTKTHTGEWQLSTLGSWVRTELKSTSSTELASKKRTKVDDAYDALLIFLAQKEAFGDDPRLETFCSGTALYNDKDGKLNDTYNHSSREIIASSATFRKAALRLVDEGKVVKFGGRGLERRGCSFRLATDKDKAKHAIAMAEKKERFANKLRVINALQSVGVDTTIVSVGRRLTTLSTEDLLALITQLNNTKDN